MRRPVHWLMYDGAEVYQLQEQNHSHGEAIFQLSLNNFSTDSGFLLPMVFSDEYVSHVSGFSGAQTICVWSRNSKIDWMACLTPQNVLLWCAAHGKTVVGPCYFSNETVGGSGLFSEDGRLRQARSSTITTKCIFTAVWSFSSHYTSRPFRIGMKSFQILRLEGMVQQANQKDPT